ncbi:hypothetical protein [Parvibaculum sp.]|uniref:hypothetical protein n=1 Tax=Parvibaculum sp. TaxID=2024848 RepID=UPI00271EC48B|nr:hypothetical protein [Parvibaculum sp.]MDO9127437.1 hypothetical protein [Parvibaculum sp.]MDP1626714.1 hypothetical protein [Parvibaculum sp.]MDP3329144.1 hypothetical protein [Parvibaculum sp.]
MLKKKLKEWLHDAALAAEVFTGQPHWYEAGEAGFRAAKKPVPARKTRDDFPSLLRAAD